MKIIFVRHGLTKSNIEKRYSVAQTQLDESGIHILHRTSQLLNNYKIDKVYTSKLIRSQETAKYLGYSDFIIDARINEMDFGDFKGKTLAEVRENEKDFFLREKNDYFNIKYPNGESRTDLIKRTSDFLDEVSSQDKNILAISHGIAIKSTLFWVLKDLSNWSSFWIDNGSLTVFDISEGKKLLESVNIK